MEDNLADTFTVHLPRNWKSRWPEVKAAAKKYNFDVDRKGNDVAFNGYGIEGNIKISGNTAHVTIDKKPFYLSKSLIIKKVEDFLKGQR
jgi:hypothetical protein